MTLPPTASRPASPFTGYFDYFHQGEARGWACDMRSGAPVTLHILLDQQEIMQVSCTQERRDVQTALNLPTPHVGFSFLLPDTAMDGTPHELSVRLPDRSILPLILPDAPPQPTIHFAERFQPQYKSFIDGIRQGVIRGWLLKTDRPGAEPTGSCLIAVMANGVKIAQTRASRYRGDVAAALGCDPNCGFEVPLPQHLRGSTPREFQILTLPDRTELNGSPFTTSVVGNQLETRLADLLDVVDGLHRQMSTLRREIRDLMPRTHYSLDDYDRWARKYYPTLRTRIAQQREHDSPDTPLVSILCPTYRPLRSDFEAAIQSVLNQTYPNWELIIIDDAGKCAETTATIKTFCKADKRIRALPLKKNAGISGATNAGIDAAQGQYIAFFDHDDLLVDVAIETMVRAAQKTGARFLYSDEDKIDQTGQFLEPNLKPDFNYRYLLGCNYICHLAMIDTATARAIGPLASHYDGAQDHDFMLRMTEHLKPSEIHHVREILYHWRKTPNSTAVTISNKTYAVDAGVRCVQDHLNRRQIPAHVSAIHNLTIYNVEWQPEQTPKVTIIIPFKDHVETTRTCVEALLHHTTYPNFEILLVNNWSIEHETAEFIADIQQHPKVSVLTVEEPFNYSRLNNLAAAEATGDFLLFLNNDVFVEQDTWLTLMVGEALSSPDIGAVGAKLLYPNNRVQHAGVAVGPVEIGTHVHHGLPASEYGYVSRALLPHDITAVTAAAMLVRASLFHETGGFDEQDLTIAYNDVDLCLKIRTAGYRIIFCATATAYHHESLSRGSDDRPEHEARFFHETQTMLSRWTGTPLFDQDPAYPRFFTVGQQPFFDLADPESL